MRSLGTIFANNSPMFASRLENLNKFIGRTNIMSEEKKAKLINFRDMSTCEATIQMLQKAAADGVETAFSRAADMKPCPIGADSACCKHCFMGPCRLNSKDPYAKVGVCGATI